MNKEHDEANAQPGYHGLVNDLGSLIESGRRGAARAVNALMTATYWLMGQRIVEFEQGGFLRAEYGTQLFEQLALDLGRRYGRGFRRINLQYMRGFYLAWPPENIRQTLSDESPAAASSEAFPIPDQALLVGRFPLPWSAYVRLLSVQTVEARTFYESEALRAGWSVRQLDRQISTRFYERVMASKDKAALLKRSEVAQQGDRVTPQEELRDSYVLEFAGLKDEYSESELEAALILRLEQFLLELGDDFAFIGRQRRLRVDDQWFRVDLLLFHRRLRCLIVVDLKVGRFAPGDAGQMHFYLNYAREHWTREGENPPVGLILCLSKTETVARYSLEGLPNAIMAAEYKTVLPDTARLESELTQARRSIEDRHERQKDKSR